MSRATQSTSVSLLYIKVFNILEQGEYDIIIDYMKKRNLYYSNAIEFLYETGLRVEELAFTEKDIVIQKGKVPSADTAMFACIDA